MYIMLRSQLFLLQEYARGESEGFPAPPGHTISHDVDDGSSGMDIRVKKKWDNIT